MHCGQHRPRHDSRKAHGFGVKAIFPRLGPTPDASHHTGLILNEVVFHRSPVSLTVLFRSRFDPFQGFATSRQTFVHRRQSRCHALLRLVEGYRRF